MKKLTLIAIAAVLSASFLSSCDKKDDTLLNPDLTRYTSNYDFMLTGTQVVPANASTASGRIQGTYDRTTKVFTYTLTWSGLSAPIAANGITIKGVADRGFTAITVAPLAAYTNGIVQQVTGNATTTSGTYSGSIYADGISAKESDLLNNKFYVEIVTTATSPKAELRGQIIFH